ncbi:hypothetical protein FD754_010923, partial [Muntiacus muntjak]
GSSHLPQQLKFTTSDSCDRIKDEFQLLQAQYHRFSEVAQQQSSKIYTPSLG